MIFATTVEEELVVALKNYDLHNAADAMDTIRSAIADTSTVFYNKHVNVTISVGVAEYLRNNVDSSSVQEQIASTITLADERMYKGKQSSKNIVVSEWKILYVIWFISKMKKPKI